MTIARKLRRVAISPVILVEMFTTGWNGDGVRCLNGLPDGCFVRSFGYDHTTDTYWLTVEHHSFDLVKEGNIIPLFYPVFTKEDISRLKPCPFCGTEAHIAEGPCTTWHVECMNPNCQASTCTWCDRESAIRCWNERVTGVSQ